MRTRLLGNAKLETSALGLGTMGMSMAYGPTDDSASAATIRRAYELGITMFDTAELYGLGTGANERLLGAAVRPFRDEVLLATKFGYDMTADQSLGEALDSRPSHIREVVENSLRHLGTDRIDVLYQHRVDPAVPIEDVAGTVAELVREGKVLHFGLSEAGPGILRRAHAVHPVTVLQSEYSVFERAVEAAVLPTARELGIGFVAYSPLGRGFLTGAVRPADQYPADDMRRFDPRWQGDNYPRNAAAVDRLAGLAGRKGIAVTQLALAWLLAQGDDVVPIFGTRSPDRLAENAAAAEVELSDADLAVIRAALPNGSFGSRYAGGHLPSWEREA